MSNSRCASGVTHLYRGALLLACAREARWPCMAFLGELRLRAEHVHDTHQGCYSQLGWLAATSTFVQPVCSSSRAARRECSQLKSGQSRGAGDFCGLCGEHRSCVVDTALSRVK